MTTILDIEQIEWKAVTDELPDAETTVLVYAPGADEPVWLGYYDGDAWDTAEGMPYAPGSVTAWAAMPGGPKPCGHQWRYVKDWMGDPNVINGTQDCSFYRCERCGKEVTRCPEDYEDPREMAADDARDRRIDDALTGDT